MVKTMLILIRTMKTKESIYLFIALILIISTNVYFRVNYYQNKKDLWKKLKKK